MLANIIGTFDWPATAVMVAFAFGASIAFIAWVNRTPTDMQRRKLQNERDLNAATVKGKIDVELARVQQNMITSHRENSHD